MGGDKWASLYKQTEPILALVLVIVDERSALAEAGLIGAIRTVWQGMAPTTVVNTELSFATVEVAAMLAEMYRRRKDREI